MIGGIFLFYLIIFVVAIILNIWIARKFEGIAKAKGHETEPIFAMCFFLGITGYLYVIALPNTKLDSISLKQEKRTLEFISEINNQLSEINSKINNEN